MLDRVACTLLASTDQGPQNAHRDALAWLQWQSGGLHDMGGTLLILRDGETTIKIKFALLRGGGVGGRKENRPETLFLVGNATTIKI